MFDERHDNLPRTFIINFRDVGLRWEWGLMKTCQRESHSFDTCSVSPHYAQFKYHAFLGESGILCAIMGTIFM